jgi:hypothetical protein
MQNGILSQDESMKHLKSNGTRVKKLCEVKRVMGIARRSKQTKTQLEQRTLRADRWPKKAGIKATTHTKRIQINIAIFIYATVKLEIEGMGQAVG